MLVLFVCVVYVSLVVMNCCLFACRVIGLCVYMCW